MNHRDDMKVSTSEAIMTKLEELGEERKGAQIVRIKRDRQEVGKGWEEEGQDTNSFPLRESQTRTVPSREAETRSLPLESNATWRTVDVCPSRGGRIACHCQRFQLRSREN